MTSRFISSLLSLAVLAACGQAKKKSKEIAPTKPELTDTPQLPLNDKQLTIKSFTADRKFVVLGKDSQDVNVKLSWSSNAKSCLLETTADELSTFKVVPTTTESYVVHIGTNSDFTLRCDKDLNTQAKKSIAVKVAWNTMGRQVCGDVLVAGKANDKASIYAVAKDEVIASAQNGEILSRTISKADANGFQEIRWDGGLARIKATDIEDSCDPKAKLEERLKIEKATPFVRDDGSICDIAAGTLKVLYAFEQSETKSWAKVTVFANPYTQCPTANFTEVTGRVNSDAVSRVLSYEGYPTETALKIQELKSR